METETPDHVPELETDRVPVLVDAHVHLYPGFDRAECLAAAWRNFAAACGTEDFVGLLLLTETWQDQAFDELAARAEAGEGLESAAGERWTLKRTREPESLLAESHPGRTLFLLAGRQVQTREGLEVLVTGSLDAPPDGVSLRDAVEHARKADALPVIPWGFGKWWGRRGRLLTRFLSESQGELFLGDNGGRPAAYPEPPHFRRGRSRGIDVLPGSDPLPLASQSRRAGSYGFRLEASIDPDAPCRSLKAAIRDRHFAPTPFGTGERPLRFAKHQVLMQIRKQRGEPGAFGSRS